MTTPYGQNSLNYADAALVLAGGQSRRMGRDKALLTFSREGTDETGGITLLQQTCKVAQSCAKHTYVLTPWPERYCDLLSSAVVLLKESAVGRGPLIALAQGWSMILAHAQNKHESAPCWLLVLACDMPALDASTLQTWQGQLKTVREDAIALLPRHNNRWEPLCGFYHQRCIPSLETAVQSNIRSLQQWLDHETVIPLTVGDSHILQNCNTPMQWQQFLASTEARNP